MTKRCWICSRTHEEVVKDLSDENYGALDDEFNTLNDVVFGGNIDNYINKFLFKINICDVCRLTVSALAKEEIQFEEEYNGMDQSK